MPGPSEKIYHILHIDRLESVVRQGGLFSDSEGLRRGLSGTVIGIPEIKRRRLENAIPSFPDLRVGDCVPFYFCPRSIMLYLISRRNHPALSYRGGQEPIVHLVADLRKTVTWADANGVRWAFTNRNAGSFLFKSFTDLHDLPQLDWDAIHATDWQRCRDDKQAEFLLAGKFPWELVEHIGTFSKECSDYAERIITGHVGPGGLLVEIRKDWYY